MLRMVSTAAHPKNARLPKAAQEGALAAFEAGGISLVAKRPSPAHLEDIRGILPNATQIYLSADQHAPAELMAEGAAKLVASGFCPVPHVAVRMFADDVALDAFLRSLSNAGATEIFVIAGDVHRPA